MPMGGIAVLPYFFPPEIVIKLSLILVHVHELNMFVKQIAIDINTHVMLFIILVFKRNVVLWNLTLVNFLVLVGSRNEF